MNAMILAAARAALPAGVDRRTDVTMGRHHLVADHPTEAGGDDPGAGPTAHDLLMASLASCTAMSVRTFLDANVAEDSAGADVAVTVQYDIGPPTVVHRRVRIGAELDDLTRRGLADAVEHTPVTDLLRFGLSIRTRIDSGGEAQR